MSNRFYPNIGKIYAPHFLPVMMNVNFTVNASDSGGFGVTNVFGPGIQAVYMHTSATAATGNPNPASGYLIVRTADNYNSLLGFDASISSPNSGTNVNIDLSDAALTVGQVYVITTLGTSTAADWTTVGLQAGLTPAIGQVFTAIATGAGTGTGKVQVPKATGSGISHLELIGQSAANQFGDASLSPIGAGSGVVGSWFHFQYLAATNSSTTTFVATAPAAGSIVSLKLYLSNSSTNAGAAGTSVGVNGQ